MHKKILVLLSLLSLSWFIPLTQQYWQHLDTHTYFLLNKSLIGHSFLQQAAAWINSRYGDWLYESIIVGTYLIYIALPTSQSRKAKAYNMLQAMLCIVLVQIINKMIFCELLSLTRHSPSMTLERYVDLSAFSYPNNKVISYNSFPADHAITLFLCSLFSWQHFNKPIATGVTVLSLLMILPRLASGAHWLSDVILGAGVIAALSWMVLKGRRFSPPSTSSHRENNATAH